MVRNLLVQSTVCNPVQFNLLCWCNVAITCLSLACRWWTRLPWQAGWTAAQSPTLQAVLHPTAAALGKTNAAVASVQGTTKGRGRVHQAWLAAPPSTVLSPPALPALRVSLEGQAVEVARVHTQPSQQGSSRGRACPFRMGARPSGSASQ